MKTIYLQRQGSTDTFNTLNAINTDLGYYIEVKAWSDNRYNIIIVSTRKQDDDTKNKRIEITAVYLSLSDAFRRVEKRTAGGTLRGCDHFRHDRKILP